MLSNRPATVLRGVLILAVVGIWLAIGAIGGQAQGKLSSVQENDAAAFLPANAESTRAANLARDFVDSESLPALVTVTAADGGALTPSQLDAVNTFAQAAAKTPLPGATADDPATVRDTLTVDPAVVPSEDGKAALVIVATDAAHARDLVGPDNASVTELVVDALRDQAQPADGGLNGAELEALVTGPAGFVADLGTAFAGIDTVLLLVALAAVLIILAVVYRSPTLPFLVILTAVFALCLAGLVVYQLAANDVLTLNGQSQGILSILVVGASVDYSLLVVARYREELRQHRSTYTALRQAVRASIAPIAASAGTVIAGLLCLLLSDLSSNRSLGPVAAIGITASFLASLTLLPALLLIGGRRARALFWPRVPHYVELPAATGAPTPSEGPEALTDESGATVEGHRLWSRIARFVGRRDRRVWIATTLALAAAAAFVPTLDASGTSEADLFLTHVDSVDGEKVLTEHFPGMSAQPVTVVAPEGDLAAVVKAAKATDGVGVAVPATDTPAARGLPAQGDPLVVDGRVRVDVTTTAPADTNEATRTVADLRAELRQAAPDALVGGAAAERLDTVLTGQRDLRVIIPAVLLVILLILIVLLRSLLAPVLLIVANVLSFGAALGVSALFFDHVAGFPGADPTVPLYAFCFLVALGVDYSIFLMTRVREESLRLGTRSGVLRALAVTGSVITSAGVVLAATFAALGIIPLLFLAQVAFIVAFGVLLDTLVVRSLLVPALVHDLGSWVWWPSRGWRDDFAAEREGRRASEPRSRVARG